MDPRSQIAGVEERPRGVVVLPALRQCATQLPRPQRLPLVICSVVLYSMGTALGGGRLPLALWWRCMPMTVRPMASSCRWQSAERVTR